MNSSDRDNWIEIELTDTAPEHARARRHPRRDSHGPSDAPPHRARPVEPATLPETEHSPTGPRRTVAIAAGVGVAGLVIGWLAGSVGDTAPAAAPASTATTVAAATSEFADDPALVEPAAPELGTTTTASTARATTTTTVPAVTVTELDLDPRLAGLPIEIVTVRPNGDVEYLDLARGRLTSIDGPSFGGSDRLFAGDGWVMIPSGSSDEVLVYVDDDPAPRRVPGMQGWSLMHQAGAATVWQPDNGAYFGFAGTMRELAADGAPTGATFDVPANPLMIDSSGAWIVQWTGGTYELTEAGTRRITTGRLLGLGPTTALVEECDEHLTCGYLVVDRISGDRRTLDVADDGLRPVEWFWPPRETVSPDGRFAFVISAEGVAEDELAGVRPIPAVIDLTTGAAVRVPIDERQGGYFGPSEWSPDSRFVFFLAASELLAYDTTVGDVFPVRGLRTSAGMLNAFDIRPARDAP